MSTGNGKIKLATAWLDGCSGCHMSILDLDEGILSLAARADLVHSPLVDTVEFPEGVDVTLVEGAVSSLDDAAKLQVLRARSRVLVALGDCAVTGNVPAMRNRLPVKQILQRLYVEGADVNPGVPTSGVPPLLAQARPLHEFVKVDFYLPGCPPDPKAILSVLTDVLAGRPPKLPPVKFG
jgi:NAD-reducing hydrogenase small subunit